VVNMVFSFTPMLQAALRSSRPIFIVCFGNVCNFFTRKS
jgi:hypothetical protein